MFFLLLTGMVCLIGSAFAQEFSGEQTTISQGRKEVDLLYFRPDRWRMEAKDADFPDITIFRLDKKVVWKLFPLEKKYMEIPLRPEDLPVPEKIMGEIDRKVVGQEEVEGQMCDKLIVRYSSESAEGGVAEMTFWISQQLQVPIRTEAPELGWRTEIKGIKMGPQADSLFEIPQGFEVFVPPLEFFLH
ncbi:MAG: DUF4412 domain-containing protein [candidate division NC10 bacterium]|nr:DUF4412 domain-containing protein [candidate division NC10 bacterium]